MSLSNDLDARSFVAVLRAVVKILFFHQEGITAEIVAQELFKGSRIQGTGKKLMLFGKLNVF
jgi:hypothetical protein